MFLHSGEASSDCAMAPDGGKADYDDADQIVRKMSLSKDITIHCAALALPWTEGGAFFAGVDRD